MVMVIPNCPILHNFLPRAVQMSYRQTNLETCVNLTQEGRPAPSSLPHTDSRQCGLVPKRCGSISLFNHVSDPYPTSFISFTNVQSTDYRIASEQFGPSAIVRLNFLRNDIYVVSGAEYLNAIWKNTKGMTSTNGINIALSNMFDTPKQDMMFFEADKSGITHDPHPKSLTRPEDRVFYLMHKATVDCLAGSHITIATEKFQAALKRRIEAISVRDEWVEMDDLFSFLRPLISYSTIEAMCGAKFLIMFPDFPDNFWTFNKTMPKLLQGWPRWAMPAAWQARDRCISTMRQWRKISNESTFDGNAMILRRWSYFSKMQGLSDDGVACSDLGILWG